MRKDIRMLPYPVDYKQYTAKITELAEIQKCSKAEALRRCIDNYYGEMMVIEEVDKEHKELIK